MSTRERPKGSDRHGALEDRSLIPFATCCSRERVCGGPCHPKPGGRLSDTWGHLAGKAALGRPGIDSWKQSFPPHVTPVKS